MKVGESQELLTQFEQDLAAEQNPDIRTWYEQEFMLQPEFTVAQQAKGDLNTLVMQLGRLAEIKSFTTDRPEANNADDEPIEEPSAEPPRILSPEELAQKRIARKYQTCLKGYKEDLSGITATKKSKREHLEKMATRKFARNFCNIEAERGLAHLVLEPELLEWATTELFDDESLADGVMDSCVDYAEHNGREITSDPNRFAAIIAGSVSETPNAAYYDKILGAIYSPRHNSKDFKLMELDLANATFSLLNNQAALKQVLDIAFFKGQFAVIHRAGPTLFRQSLETVLDNNAEKYINENQATAIFDHLNYHVIGTEYSGRDVGQDMAYGNTQAWERVVKEMSDKYGISEDEVLERIPAFHELYKTSIMYDPAKLKNLEGKTIIDFQRTDMPEHVLSLVRKSPFFVKRMQEISPYAYAVISAKSIFKGGCHGTAVALSPSITLEAYLPMSKNSTGPDQVLLQRAAGAISANIYGILGLLSSGGLEIKSYKNDGEIEMITTGVNTEGKLEDGIIIVRPLIQFDKSPISPIQLLSINFAKVLHNLHSNGKQSSEKKFDEDIVESNEALRSEISLLQKRFLGRRPIKFTLPKQIRETGLQKVSLRHNANTASVKAMFTLNDGDVEIELDRELRVKPLPTDEHSFIDPGIKEYYENLVLKLMRIWACENEVNTSEGIVSESSGNAANMGHFAYLRIRESDGKRFRFSQEQKDKCLEEQNKDLAVESERLKLQDPTGRQRNSTYVRENYDPNKPPLEIYYSADILT